MANTSTLETLAQTTFDSIEGYRKAAAQAKSPHLQSALQDRAQKREATLQKLNAELEKHGTARVTSGSATGGLHRIWTDITGLFEKGDEAAAERVEEGEDYIKDKFEEALKDTDLDQSQRLVIEQCFGEIREGERFGDMIEKQYD